MTSENRALAPNGEARTAKPDGTSPPWHSRATGETMAALATGASGLSVDEARIRLETGGPNRLPEPPRAGAVARFLRQFNNLLIYVLLGA
ncbi:cation-transporting P-type ATPase, partial [Roseicyclus sp.]|uniref:cation-transporting P-type ATPase n=1 Tax=Roseicyclus sp. TaxID=1914329 RepID=UPI003F9F428D